jgi:hypothetical protein
MAMGGLLYYAGGTSEYDLETLCQLPRDGVPGVEVELE